MKVLFQADESWPGLILRPTLGLVMFPHGAQKLLGWYDGVGFSGTMGFFMETLRLPWLIAFLDIIGESLGSVALLLGFVTRFRAASFAVVMLGGHYNGPSAQRIVHELVREAGRRRI